MEDGWVEKSFRSGNSMKFADDMEFAGNGAGSYVYAVGTGQDSMIVRAGGDGDAGERLRDGFQRLQEGIRHGGRVLGLAKEDIGSVEEACSAAVERDAFDEAQH